MIVGSKEWLEAKIAQFEKDQQAAKESFITLGGAIQAYKLQLDELPKPPPTLVDGTEETAVA